MTMTMEQIQQYVLAYLDITECRILEKSPHHVTVKLSPQADKDLTNRPYYWGFIERTGAEPETMSFKFVFDAEHHDADLAAAEQNEPKPQEDQILGRHYGAIRPLPILGPSRIQREDLAFGSPRLKQIFDAALRRGRCVYLFESAAPRQRMTLLPAAYEPWLGVNFKIEFCCDMKREELRSLGISLLTGQIDPSFGTRLQSLSLVPRVPENVHIEPTRLSLTEGRDTLERIIREEIEAYDQTWAEEANERLQEELLLIDGYYTDLLRDPDEERKKLVQEQYESRRGEIRWQYEPRIVVSAINCGIFHLRWMR
ncbi:YqhG family protein [Paenibacillus ihumii]|uniref:YqhG family protein n=1 Tax=Paenibacillus ihumii TaxID=687436 RepID=UPI0006D82879|nr:YqhG family protein [Paenibacillus ihumii]